MIPCQCFTRGGPPCPRLCDGGRGVAGAERHLPTPLLHVRHRRPVGQILLLLWAAQAAVLLLPLDPAGEAESHDGQRYRPGQQVGLSVP